MERRRYLGLASVVFAGLSGCTASAFSVPGLSGPEDTPSDCPEVLAVDETVCTDTDGPLTVDQSSEVVSGDGWSLYVVIENESDAAIEFNPNAWSLFRREGTAWKQVAPDAIVEPALSLSPAGRYGWQLTDTGDGFEDADKLVVVDLDPATYAFAVPVRAERSMAAVVTFEVSR